MPRRGALRNWTEYGAVLIAVFSLEWAPLGLAHVLGKVYARLLDLAIPRLRRVARRNLEAAYPELVPVRREAIIDGVFGSVGRLLVSFARFPRIHRGNLDRWIRLEGGEHFETARRRGRGVLFATAHLGNWELIGSSNGAARSAATAPSARRTSPARSSRPWLPTRPWAS
jgi:KDO2-lipid IV(A) lauroyltransferase